VSGADDGQGAPTDVAAMRAALDERDVAFGMDRLAWLLRAGAGALARDGISVEPETPAPALKPKRPRRPSPSRLAKWEAAWQAEQGDDEVES
jgi:hypothetical protein